MKNRALLVSLSTTLLISGCASMGKDGRIGQNDGSDPCFVYLDRLDEMAIYYKDQRMKDITAGVLIGGGTGALAGMVAGGNSTAMIVGGVTGAIVGGFAADAYWKNQLQKANNQLEQAMSLVGNDLKQDIDKLSSLDKDITALVRCRTNQRDMIKKQFAEGKIPIQQAQQEWKKWGELIRKDQEEIKYLNEALDNIRKIEDSYNVAATAIESPSTVTEDMQKKWKQELQIEKQKEIVSAEEALKMQLTAKRIKSTEKKKLKYEHKQKITEIQNQYASKEAKIKNKENPKGNPLKLMISSVHEKHESIQKSKDQFDNLALEAGKNNGFEQINSKLFPVYKYADFLAYTHSASKYGAFISSPAENG